jgi:hypothetical protein
VANWANVGRLGDPSTPDWQAKNLKWIEPIKGQRWQVYGPAAAAFEGLLGDLAQLGYHPISSGGFNYRNIRGGDELSQHAFGTAIDLNAMTNAMGQSATDIPHAADLAKKWGLEWGGNWQGRPDPMHFEYTGGADTGARQQQGPVSMGSDPQTQFINQYWPYAVQVSKTTGIDPRVIMAQAALETGYGKSAPNNNYFGIKGAGPAAAALPTKEADATGKLVDTYGNFATYESPEDSFNAYAKFMMGDRYAPVRSAKGLDEQIKALGASGYATDPEYAAKLQAIAAKIPEGGYGYDASPAPNAAPSTGAAATPAIPAAPKKQNFLEAFGDAVGKMNTGGAKFATGMPNVVTPAARADAEAVAPVASAGADRRQALAEVMARLNSGRLW